MATDRTDAPLIDCSVRSVSPRFGVPSRRSGPGESMGVLQEFERRLEGAVEGFFARAFRSGVQPIELAKAVQRYAETNQHVTADGVVVPNVYRLAVGDKDHARLEGYGASLPRELAEVVAGTAAERGWTLRGPARVKLERDGDILLGRYRLAGRVEVAEDPAPARAGAHSSSRPDWDHRPAIQHTQVVTGPPRADLRLTVRSSGGPAGASVELTGSRVTIGRLPECDLSLDDSTVSRQHAAVVRRADGWWIVDLNSTNGTTVNGRRSAEHPLTPGDRIELGDVLVELAEG